MSIEVQRRYGTTEEHETFIGALAEITIDTDKNVVVVHDGVTAGGFAQDNARKILSKTIDISDFTGLDGYLLAYDETEDKFYLKKDDGGGGGGLVWYSITGVSLWYSITGVSQSNIAVV